MVLYRNTRSFRVRILHALLWLITLGLCAWLIAQARAGDGDSWLLLAILGPLFVVLAIGMEVYLRCYVVQLTDVSGKLHIETLSTFGRAARDAPWADVSLGRELHDVFETASAPSVDNSAILIRVARRRLPLIVDTTADPLNIRALQRGLRRTGR